MLNSDAYPLKVQMQISWQVDPSDIPSIHHLMDQMADKVFVRERIGRYVEGGRSPHFGKL